MHKNITPRLIALLTAASISSLAQAGEQEPVYDLGQMAVSAAPVQGSTFSVDQQDLKVLNARSLEDALRLSPSINIRYGGDGTPRMDIRGLRTRQIKLMVNGIPFSSTNDGQFDPSLIPAFAIGRIDTRIGNSSVLYGDGGSAGVIDIKTRGAFEGFRAESTLERGSDDFWLANGNVGYADDDQQFFFGYGVRDRDDFSLSSDFSPSLSPSAENFQDDDTRNNSDNRRENLMMSYNRDLTEKLTVGVFASHLHGEYGKPAIVFDRREDDFANWARYERVESQRGHSLQVGADYQFNQQWSGRLWAFHNQMNERIGSYDDLTLSSVSTDRTFFTDSESRNQGIHGQLNGFIESTNTEVALSFDHRTEDYQEDRQRCNIGGSGGGSGGGNGGGSGGGNGGGSGGGSGSGGGGNKNCPTDTPYDVVNTDEDLQVRSLAFEVTQPLPADITAVVGLARHEMDVTGGDDSEAHSWQVLLSKPLTAVTTLYGSTGQKVDAPSIRQLYDSRDGNPNLRFQKGRHYEAGLKNRWQDVALDVAVWRTDFDNFIQRGESQPRLFVNRDKLRFEGVDINASWQATSALKINAGLGFLDAEARSTEAPTDQLQYRPSHKATLQAIYRFNPQWQITGDVIRIGEQNYLKRRGKPVRRKLDAYELVNTKLTYRFPSGKADVYVGVENLLDEDYQTSYGYPQPGRFVYSGVNLRW